MEKQERPGGRLKAEIRPLVSLPTAKPLVGSLPVARNLAPPEGREKLGEPHGT